MEKSTNFEEPKKVFESVIISQKVIPYLQNLGYVHFDSEVPIHVASGRSRIDVLVYFDDEKLKPYIVVEAKQKLSNEIELLDPAVQQAFVKAVAIGKHVRYLLITDGQKHFWFERSSEGRSLIQLSRAPEKPKESRSLPSETPLVAVADPKQFSRLMQSAINVLMQEGMILGVRMGIELNRILIAKLHDERIVQGGGPHRFRANLATDVQVASNIEQLYREAFIELGGEPLEEGLWFLSPHALSTVVKILEPYALSSVTSSIRGHLFWQTFSELIRKNEAEFTTPVPLADFLVQLTQPHPGQRIIDPACGTGLLLLTAHEFIEAQVATEHRLSSNVSARLALQDEIVGVEINAEVGELAITNFVLNGLSPRQIIKANALDKKELELLGIKMNSYDVVLLHPPIGLAPKNEHILRQFGISSSRATLEMLFVELSVELLRPGGVSALLVPDTLLSSPTYQNVRSRILNRTRLRAIISLPPETFNPIGHSGKATILLLEKEPTESKFGDQVIIADIQSVGYDRFGHPIGKNDLPDLIEALDAYRTTGIIETDSQEGKLRLWTVALNDLSPKRLDVGQFDPASNEIVYALRHGQYPSVKLNEVVDIISGRNFKTYVEKGLNTAVLVQAGAVRDLTLDLSNIPSISVKDYDSAKSAHIKTGDILVTTTGAYLGRAAVFDLQNTQAVASGAVTILRSFPGSNVDPFFLAAVISSALGKEQITQRQAASTGQPYIRRADLGTITIPLPNLSKQRELAERIRTLLLEAQKLTKRAQEIESSAKKLIVNELLGAINNE
jgi:type I restriction enzyme M protein